MKRIFFGIIVLLVCSFSANGATVTSTVTGGNWNDPNTWDSGVPASGDDVIISIGATVVVTADATCSTLSFLAGTSSTTVSINSGISLTVTNTIVMPRTTVTGTTNTIAVGAGFLNANNISFTEDEGDRRHRITISTGTVTITGDVTSANSLGVSPTFTFTGAGLLRIGGAFLTANTATLNAVAGSTVEYYSDDPQTAASFAYANLTLSGLGQKTFTTAPTINGVLSLEDAATISSSGGVIYGTTATLQYNTASDRSSTTPEWISPFTASGGVVIANTGIITMAGTKILNTGVPLTVNSGAKLLTGGDDITVGGTTTINGNIELAGGLQTFNGNVIVNSGGVWDESDPSTEVVFAGNFTNNSSTFTPNSGLHTFSGTSKLINGATAITIENVIISGSYTNNNTLSVTTDLSGVGSLTNGATGILNLGGTVNLTTLTANAAGNLVNYNGAISQSVKTTAYNDLTLSGSGNKSFGAALTIGGNLTISTSAKADLGTFSSTAGTLIFNSTSQGSGSWGSTGSAATNKNDTYFLSTSSGVVNITSVNNTWNGNTSTSWNTGSNWSAGVPTSIHSVIIGTASNQPTVDATANCYDLTINSGGHLTVGGFNITVTGGTSISGTITMASATGTKTFLGPVTINTGGNFSETAAANISFDSDFTNNGTFSGNTGTHTFTGAAKIISGSATTSIDNMAVTGSYSNTNTLTVSTDLSGSGSLTNSATGVLNLGGTSGISTLIATASGNTVNYTGIAQTLKVINYHNLTLSNGAKTFGAITNIAGHLILTGSATATTSSNLTIGGNLNIGNGTDFTVGANDLTVTGTTTVGGGTSGTLTFSSTTGSKVFTGLVTIASGALWTNSANEAIEFRGGITTTPDFTGGSGVHTFSTNNQAISGIFTIPNVSVSSGITLTNNGNLTCNTALDGPGSFANGATGTLNIGGTTPISTLTATAVGNSINYTGTGQSLKVIPYHHLTLSGGAKTFGAITTIGGNLSLTDAASATTAAGAAITISGNLALSGTSSFTLANVSGASLTISGNLVIGDGTTFNSQKATTISGSTTIGNGSSGTLLISSAIGSRGFGGTVTINSGGQLIESINGNLQFVDLINNGTLTEAGNATFSISGNFTNNGAYTSSSGNHSFTNTGKIISGSSPITISKVLISGTRTNNGTLIVTSSLQDAGTLTNGATGVLTIGSSITIATLNATAVGNIVNYNSIVPGQALKVTAYHHLNLSGASKSFGTISTIAGDLTLSSSATAIAAPATLLTIGGNLNIGSGTSFDVSAGKFVTVNGTTTSTGNLNLKSTVAGTASFITASASGSGNNVERYMTGGPLTTDPAHFLSSPVSGLDISTFLSGSGLVMRYHDESTGDWVTGSPGGNFTPARGYVFRKTSTGVASFAGSLVTSTSFTLSYSNPGNYGWNCVGNPFTSSLNVSTFLSTNSAVLNGSYANCYVYRKGLTPLYLPVGTGYLPSGQGFFVKASDPAGSLSYTSGMQSHQNPTFYKKSGDETSQKITLHIANNTLSTETNVFFSEGMTKGLDITYDAGIFGENSDFALYTKLIEDNGVNFYNQYLSDQETSEMIVPIGFDYTAGGVVTFTAEISSLPTGYIAILEDKLLGNFTDFSIYDAKYEVAVEAGSSGTGRFFLHVVAGSNGINLQNQQKINTFAVKKVVYIQGNLSEGALASVFDVMGRKIGDYQLEISNMNILNLEAIEDGIYIVKVTNQGVANTERVMIRQ